MTHESAAIRDPVVFVDVPVCGREQLQGPARSWDKRDPLFIILLADLADLANARLGGTRFLARSDRDEQRDLTSVG